PRPGQTDRTIATHRRNAMNITHDIINDLIPLYVANECSADTRKLVEEYLLQNPRQAEQLRQIMQTPVGGPVPPIKGLIETQAFREPRPRLRILSTLLGFGIFFTAAPFSFVFFKGQTWFFLRDAPVPASIYLALGLACWAALAIQRRRSSAL